LLAASPSMPVEHSEFARAARIVAPRCFALSFALLRAPPDERSG
jgi:hypothetical protein